MSRYTVGELPESQRRAREVIRRRWYLHVSDRAPAWVATYDGKPSVVAAGPECLVVVKPGLSGTEFTLAYDGMEDETEPLQVAFRDPSGYVYRLYFASDGDVSGFRALVRDRAVATSVDAVDDIRGRSDTHRAFVVVTMDAVPGAEIVDLHGDVLGVVVRARNIFSNLGASVRTVIGGEAAGYTKLLTDSRLQARDRLVDAALELGANAVVGMRYDSTEISDLMSEVTAYGTAVTIRPAT